MNPTPTRSVLTIAAVASAGAGMVHAAAAGAHADDRTLAGLFAAAAVLQVGWAAIVALRPSRTLVLAGVLLQAGLVGVWAASRTTGIGAIDSLADVQDASFQDVTAAGLALVAAFAASIALRPRAPRRSWHPAVGAITAVAAVALAVPAMAFPHTHDHDHDGGAVDVAAGAGATGVGHEEDGHPHAKDDGHAEGDDGHGHEGTAPGGDDGAPAVDARLAAAPGVEQITADQQRRALDLIERTTEAIGRFAEPAAAEAAGYYSIGDGFTGFEHFVNRTYLADPAMLDPGRIESLVYRVDPDGTKELASGMYILPPGTTMADVPDIAGPVTTWHDHQNLCWNDDGSLAGVLVDGVCRPSGTFRPTPPMLHVWVVDHPCGPFAGIEGSHGSGCEHEHS